MARNLRVQFPGAYDHVMAWGSRREAITQDDADRRFFLHKESLTAAGLQAMDLTGLKGSELRKVVLAHLLARQTTVSLACIGGHQHLRSPSKESQKVRRWAARPSRKAPIPSAESS